ncbi:hypothetical protein C8J56DRAFT_259343 [Mycena floridula]|nr:hypothetical protein C8J56DRAFT_259343 [Mycena floridula]
MSTPLTLLSKSFFSPMICLLLGFWTRAVALSDPYTTNGLWPDPQIQSSPQESGLRPRFRPQKASHLRWLELKTLRRSNDLAPVYHTLSKLLRDAKEDLRLCDVEIMHQDHYMFWLQEQREILQHHVQGYESLLVPIRRLPKKVLGQIFNIVCRENHVGIDTAPCIPGLTLARVCSHWRRVALSTPKLWSTITIQAAEMAQGKRWEPTLEFLLEKSGVHPLDIRVVCGADEKVVGILIQAVASLGCHSTRWRSFKLDIADMDLASHLLSSLEFLRHHLPLLESVDLSLATMVTDHNMLSIFREARKLSSVTLDRAYTDCESLIGGFHAGLRHANIDSPARLLAFLSRFDKLESLRVIHPWLYRQDSQQQIYLSSNLSKLEIMSGNSFEDLLFLDHVTLPQLTSLSLQCLPGSRLCPIDTFTSLFSRSRCILTSLTWTDLPIRTTVWISFLYGIPSLQSLTVSNVKTKHGDPDALLELLPVDSYSPPILPNLQHLDITTVTQVALDKFVRAVRSRRRDPKCNICYHAVSLKSVSLRLVDQIVENVDLEPLEYLARTMSIFVRDSIGEVPVGPF